MQHMLALKITALAFLTLVIDKPLRTREWGPGKKFVYILIHPDILQPPSHIHTLVLDSIFTSFPHLIRPGPQLAIPHILPRHLRE